MNCPLVHKQKRDNKNQNQAAKRRKDEQGCQEGHVEWNEGLGEAILLPNYSSSEPQKPTVSQTMLCSTNQNFLWKLWACKSTPIGCQSRSPPTSNQTRGRYQGGLSLWSTRRRLRQVLDDKDGGEEGKSKIAFAYPSGDVDKGALCCRQAWGWSPRWTFANKDRGEHQCRSLQLEKETNTDIWQQCWAMRPRMIVLDEIKKVGQG